jgi:hypothetical protein
MSKKLILILVFAVAIGAGAWAYNRRPIIQLESVNFLGKRIKYRMSCGGVSKAGALNFGEVFTAGGNGIELSGNNNGNRYATFQIKKDGKLVKEVKVDFLKQAIDKGTEAWDTWLGN